MLMYVNLCHWYANEYLTPTIQLVHGGNTHPLKEGAMLKFWSL